MRLSAKILNTGIETTLFKDMSWLKKDVSCIFYLKKKILKNPGDVAFIRKLTGSVVHLNFDIVYKYVYRLTV
jgi:hypothetical protein